MRVFKKISLVAGAIAIFAIDFSLPAAPVVRESHAGPLVRDETDRSSGFLVNIWRTSDGLPANEIEDLKQTPDGYLWMGTVQGLVRFDGVRFQTFFNTPTGPRYGTRIGPLEIDSRGLLWFVPDEVGVFRRDPSAFTETLTNGVLRNRAVNLCSDGKTNMMWVDLNGRLGEFSIEKPDDAQPIKGGGSTAASRWVRDFEGKMWLANLRNLKMYQKGKWRNIDTSGSSSSMAVAPRRAGGLWIARDAKLRFVTAQEKTREVATFPWIGESRVTCLLEDSRRRLWIGTIDHGLFCYSDGKFTHVAPTASGILCLLEDRNGNLWAGTRGNGLVRVSQRQFFMCDRSSGLNNEFVRSLAQDKDGRVWLLTAEKGLGWWQNGQWHELDQAEGWTGHDSLSIFPLNDGGVVISTIRRGLWRQSDGKFSRVQLGPKGPKEPIADLLEDRKKRIWMVTDNTGIFCWETNQCSCYSTNQGLPSMYIRRILEDAAGEIWAGDWEGGIVRWNGARWETARAQSGHRDAVRSMATAENTLWIGTSSGGLLRFKNGETTRVSTEQGLPDNCIQQLLLDGEWLWGSTPHRLFRISIKQLNSVMDGKADGIDAIVYGRSDGLPDVSFANWSDPRCWRAANGELWFATANGAIHFQPSQLQETEPPQVLLEQTLLDGKPILIKALQQLRPGPGRLEFRFTAPCLTAPERIRFRYQLTGVDSDWVEGETGRTATYGSVPAGNHVFRVMASSPEGVWNVQPATIALAVHPFFWQTNWFLAAVAAAIAGGAVWIFRRTTVRRLNFRLERMRQQNALNRERTRIAQDIHDELGANLTSIGLLADMGARHKADPVAVTRELDQISQTARESVVAMDAIVWALNPRNDSLDNFANYIAEFTREFFRPTQLRTRLELPANLPPHPLATETRHQLFLLVKESFNNIVRHAEATEVNLELACDNDHLRLIVADNGRGLSGKTEGEGRDGLANLRERIERLGGTLEIGSNNGQGTRLEFVLPLGKFSLN
jgi:signal transduction histidine kinase/ligand-binding sensor domain-containing protein